MGSACCAPSLTRKCLCCRSTTSASSPTSFAMLLFLPQIIKELGVTNMQVGWITMIPYIAGAISMVFCGWLSDRVGDRRWSLFTTCVISAVGLVIAGLSIGTWWSLAGITIAAIGFYGTKGPFWSMA